VVFRFTNFLQSLTISNYSLIPNSHTLQFTNARLKPFQSSISSPTSVWQRFPTSYLPQLPCSRPYWPATVSQITKLSLSLTLRPTVSRTVCFGIKHPSGAYGQIFITVKQLQVLVIWGALSDKRTGLSSTIAVGTRQRSHSRV
jgi:hypothetical protein